MIHNCIYNDTPDITDEPIKNYLLVDETENDLAPLFDIPYINSILKENNLVKQDYENETKTCYYAP